MILGDHRHAARRRRRAAARYRPPEIDLLLVGEAPPEALDRYFYFTGVREHDMRPKNIILIKVDVFDAAFEALRAAGLPVVKVRIPFPGSGQQRRFLERFREALERAPEPT